MKEILTLTYGKNNKPVYVNTAHLMFFEERAKVTDLMLTDGNELSVNESPEAILMQISQSGLQNPTR